MADTSTTSVVLAGFLLGISLIVAMGPQNILLIKQGIKREGIHAVVAVCLISDAVLFGLGVVGVGKITASYPIVLEVLRWVGATYLSWFAFTSFRDCLRSKQEREQPLSVIDEQAPTSAASADARAATLPAESRRAAGGTESKGGSGAVLTQARPRQREHLGPEVKKRPSWVGPMLTAIVLTWLNPGAWLDSMVMIGGIAHQYGDPGAWYFVGGCLIASAVWFFGVGYGAGALARPLSSPKVWRVLNGVFGVILVGLVIKLVTM